MCASCGLEPLPPTHTPAGAAEVCCWRQEQRLGAAKVNELQVALLIQQQVFRLEVSMDDLLRPGSAKGMEHGSQQW